MIDPHAIRMALRRLPPGSDINDEVFRVGRAELRSSRHGNEYLALLLEDAAGTLDARVFDATERDLAAFVVGEPVQVGGTMETWNGRPQIVVERFGAPEAAVDPALLQPPAPAPEQAARHQTQLRELLGTLTDPWLRKLRDRILLDDTFMGRFCEWPGATRYHHAWRGGLLEHTLSAMQLADRICAHYPPPTVNRDLVLIGVWLHDSGKVDELEPENPHHWQYGRQGKLLGHITLGLLRLERHLAALAGFPPVLADELRHIILSHHGDAERGSPRSPMTREAMIVHHVECLDSELGSVNDEEQLALPDPDGNPVFVWSRRFRRDLMLRPPADPVDPIPPA